MRPFFRAADVDEDEGRCCRDNAAVATPEERCDGFRSAVTWSGCLTAGSGRLSWARKQYRCPMLSPTNTSEPHTPMDSHGA